jgi:hypothetical protein
MNSGNGGGASKPSFVLKEFTAQKDKSTNNAVITLGDPSTYTLAKADETEAKLKKDTIGMEFRKSSLIRRIGSA